MNKPSSAHTIWTLAVIFGLSACAGSGSSVVEAANLASDEKPAATAEYHQLVGELALKNEKYEEAAENYHKAALLSDDPALSKLATELSFELGHNDAAFVTAKRWEKLTRKTDPSPQAHGYLARLYVRQGNAKKAANSLISLVKHASNNENRNDAFLALSTVLSKEKNKEVVRAAYKRMVSRNKRIPQAHYVLGLQALRDQEFEQTKKSANAAIKLDPEWGPGHLLYARALIASGEIDEGIGYAGEHIGGMSPVGERLEYGMLLAAVNRDIEASAVLDQVLSDDPTNAAALRALGLIDLKTGDLDTAERRFAALLRSGQGGYDALYFLGSIAETNEQDQRAFELYSEVKSGDNAVIAQLRAAGILFRNDKIDQALQHLDQFARTSPKHALDMSLGQGEILTQGDRKDEALLLYDNMLKQDPDEQRTQFARAFLLEDMDRVDDAIHQMRIILAQDPTDAGALNALGYTLADRTDQHQEAFELIALAYEKEPENGPITDSMGWVEFKLGNYERAAELLEKAYELLPDPEVMSHLLEVHHVSGNVDRIAELLEEVEEKFADNEDILAVRERLGL